MNQESVNLDVKNNGDGKELDGIREKALAFSLIPKSLVSKNYLAEMKSLIEVHAPP